jgi:hypothetical protein
MWLANGSAQTEQIAAIRIRLGLILFSFISRWDSSMIQLVCSGHFGL